MQLAVDLHSHSGHAGGVGNVPLEAVTETMRIKGIQVFGTGDCLFPARFDELRVRLREQAPGLFRLPGNDRDFLLQTEVILSTSLLGHTGRTVAHHLILFPSFDAIAGMQTLMTRWGMKNTVGRPFITCRDRSELVDRCREIAGLHPQVEIIPAHVMTPEGIYGGKNELECLEEFYGDFLPEIHAAETGLSADPSMLERIPDLSGLSLVSFSDVHSAALNRIGREFTVLDCEKADYFGIIEAIRGHQVAFTAEFVPTEGRYYLTGHRADRPGHSLAYHCTGDIPADHRCPVCGKPMLPGVLERCHLLSRPTTPTIPRRFQHLVPLVEVIACSLGLSSIASKKVQVVFDAILTVFESELSLWVTPIESVKELLDKRIPLKTLRQILAVHEGHFGFNPPGCDGAYGALYIES